MKKDDTFQAINAIQNDRFLCLQGGSVRLDPVIWRRFTNIQNDSYTGGNPNHPDALCFKARRNVKICGFLWTRDYQDKNFTLLVRWRVVDSPATGEPTEWVEFSASPDQQQTDFRLHLFDF